MALTYQKGTFVCPASTGNQTLSLPANFDPKGIKLHTDGQTVFGVGAHAVACHGFGTFDGGVVQQGWTGGRNEDGGATELVTQGFNSTAILRGWTAGAGTTVQFAATLVSMQSGATSQVVINWSTVLSGLIVHYEVWGGSDLTAARVGNDTLPTTAIAKDHTVAATWGQPDFLMFLSNKSSATFSDGAVASICISLGFAKSNTERMSFATSQVSGGTTMNDGAVQKARAILMTGSASLDSEADLDAKANWPVDGFRTITAVANANGPRFIYMALKGNFQSAIVVNSCPIAGSPPVTQDNAVGFPPVGALIFGRNLASTATLDMAAADGVGFSFGGYDGTTEGCTGWVVDDAAGNQQSDRFTLNTKGLRWYIPGAAPTLKSEADILFSGNNVRTSWTTIDTVAREYVVVAFGSAAAAAFTPKRRMTNVNRVAVQKASRW